MLKNLLEILGLDWLSIIFFEKKYFPFSQNPHTEEEVSQLMSQITEMDLESLESLNSQLKARLDEEKNRGNKFETKATTLLGFTALASSFILGFAQFFIGNTNITGWMKAMATGLYFSISVALLVTIILALKVVKTAIYSDPNIDDWVGLRDWNKEFIVRQYTKDLFHSIWKNTATNNNKGTYLNGAQDWFRNTIYLFLLFALLLFSTIAFTQAHTNANNYFDQPIEIIVITPTMTATPTSTPTNTSMPTITPSVVHLPTETPTPISNP